MSDLGLLDGIQRIRLHLLGEMLDRFPPPETATAIELAERAAAFVLGAALHQPAAGDTQSRLNFIGEPQKTEAAPLVLDEHAFLEAASAGCGEPNWTEVDDFSEAGGVAGPVEAEAVGNEGVSGGGQPANFPDIGPTLTSKVEDACQELSVFTVPTLCAMLPEALPQSIRNVVNRLVSRRVLARLPDGEFQVISNESLPDPDKLVACKENPFAAPPKEIDAIPASKRNAGDPLAHIVKWLRDQDIDATVDGSCYRINGRIRHTPESLVEMANRLRSKKGMPLFTLEEAAP